MAMWRHLNIDWQFNAVLCQKSERSSDEWFGFGFWSVALFRTNHIFQATFHAHFDQNESNESDVAFIYLRRKKK